MRQANRVAEITDVSCTRNFASKNVLYNGRAMKFFDGPGSNAMHGVRMDRETFNLVAQIKSCFCQGVQNSSIFGR